MPTVTVNELVSLFNLEPHPEGGYYKETYRDKGVIAKGALPQRFRGDRNFSTAIYFLLPEGSKSKMHRIESDEVWHFYLGDPLTIVQIAPDGTLKKIVMGPDVKKGQSVQHAVPAGYWFGAYLARISHQFPTAAVDKPMSTASRSKKVLNIASAMPPRFFLRVPCIHGLLRRLVTGIGEKCGLDPGSRFSFVGCTVAPGFDFAGFEMAKRSDLLAQFPNAKKEIELLTDPA